MQQSCPEYDNSCSSIIYQSVDVGLPISLTPNVKIGETKVKCCGEPVLTCIQSKCGDCKCEIMITQTICYKIPIEYSLDANVSDAICECMRRNCFDE